MLDDVSRTYAVIAVAGVLAAGAAGVWLTGLGGGVTGPAPGGSINPNNWTTAANAICDDTNAEVVDLDQSLGDEPAPAEALARGGEILGRRAEGLAALPAPPGRMAESEALIAAMRETQALMGRAANALANGELQEGELAAVGVALAPQDEAVTTLSHSLGAHWCDLFGADDATIRSKASFNLFEVQGLVERYRQDAGTYAGATLDLLRDRYGTDLVPGEAAVALADLSRYCLETTVGSSTMHLRRSGDGEPLAGSC